LCVYFIPADERAIAASGYILVFSVVGVIILFILTSVIVAALVTKLFKRLSTRQNILCCGEKVKSKFGAATTTSHCNQVGINSAPFQHPNVSSYKVGISSFHGSGTNNMPAAGSSNRTALPSVPFHYDVISQVQDSSISLEHDPSGHDSMGNSDSLVYEETVFDFVNSHPNTIYDVPSSSSERVSLETNSAYGCKKNTRK